jgi:hypothetical protein
MARKKRTPEQNRAIYARRAARARAAGTTYSKARREAAREGLKPAQVIRAAAETRRLDTAAGSVVVSFHAPSLAAAVRRAAKDGRYIGTRATFRDRYGQWRTRDQEAWWPTTVPSMGRGRQGGRRAFEPGLPAQVTTYRRGEQRQGFPARLLRDLIDYYDGDVWAAIYDLWAALYE